MSLRPLHDRVVVKRVEEERLSAGGIVIPDSASAEKPTRGEVIAVGPGKTNDNGETRAVAVNVGDTVLFGQYGGTAIKINDEELVVMREDDIMAVID